MLDELLFCTGDCMSAVLVNTEDLKAYIDNEIKKGIEKAGYVSIEEYNELKASHIDSLELLANANKRITQLEAAIFAHDGQLPLPKF